MKNHNILVIAWCTILMMGCGTRNESSGLHQHEPQEEQHSHAQGDTLHSHAQGEEHNSDASHAECAGDDHPQEAHNGESSHVEGEIVFTKAQAARTDFALTEVQPVTFHDVIRSSGRILAAQGDEATVVAPVSGIVSFSGKKITDGTSVSRGEVLFSISSKDVAEGDYVTRTRAAYEQARSAFERAEKMIGEQLISQAEFEQRRASYETARTAYEALSSRSTGKGTGVTAPISGFIKNIEITAGSYVEVGQPLATLSQNKRLLLRGEVSQRYLKHLKGVSGARFKTPYDGRVYDMDQLGGRLLSVGKSSDEGSVYVPVTFEFNNSGEIIPGSFVEVFLLATPRRNALTVPLSAVIEEQGTHHVFVQLDEEGYLKREVKLGGNDGVSVEVLSGLVPGEKVVSKGVTHVKMASYSGAIPHGHSH